MNRITEDDINVGPRIGGFGAIVERVHIYLTTVGRFLLGNCLSLLDIALLEFRGQLVRNWHNTSVVPGERLDGSHITCNQISISVFR